MESHEPFVTFLTSSLLLPRGLSQSRGQNQKGGDSEVMGPRWGPRETLHESHRFRQPAIQDAGIGGVALGVLLRDCRQVTCPLRVSISSSDGTKHVR